MLGAQKTKLHGMKDPRWTTKDKLTQYRGLVNLYTREKAVTENDAVIKISKQVDELRQLQKDILANREAFDNAINGDRQKLRNTLAAHRCMQLAYESLPPIRVIDHLHQENFNKRKELDRINYLMNQKTSRLIKAKLELAMWEDRKNYTSLDPRLPVEKQAATITAKVQDALLKKQSAIQVREAYTNILAIMKRDAVYFDSVLDALKQDGISQGRCMYKCTELGQLATEYMDDVQCQFKDLERLVKKGMKEREKSLSQVKTEVTELAESLHYLVNVENEGMTVKRLPKSISELDLIDNIEVMEVVMLYLKNLTLSPTYADIFPNIEIQLSQRKRLLTFRDKLQDEKNKLSKKVEHASLLQENLYNSMISTTFDYKQAKSRLQKDVGEKKERIVQLDDKLVGRGAIMVKIRVSLQQLTGLVKNVAMPSDKKVAKLHRGSSDSLIELPEDVDADPFKLIMNLVTRLQLLMKEAPKMQLNEEELIEAASMYQKHVEYTSFLNRNMFQVVIQDTSLVEEVSMEDSYVFSRNDIKKQSDHIVKTVLSQSEEAQIAAAAAKKK